MKLTCVTATREVLRAGNRAELVRCINSVAALKTEHEHLIYDGASTDGTVELLRELESKTPGLRVITEPDAGIYNALNKGVRDSKGEWFYVLGADDYICDPGAFDEIVAEAPEAVDEIITSVNVEGRGVGAKRQLTLHNILFGAPFSHQGVLQRTIKVREFGGFSEKYRIASDFELMFKMHLAGIHFQIREEIFACFSAKGISSSQRKVLNDEARCITCDLMNLNAQEAEIYKKSWALPWRRVIPLLAYKDLAIRMSARWYVVWRMKLFLRIILYPLVVVTRPIRSRKG